MVHDPFAPGVGQKLGPVAEEPASWDLEPHPRVTLTLRVLNAAHRVFFLIEGAPKAEALAGVRNGDTRFPASRVRPQNGSLTYLVDEAAAGQVKTGAAS